MNDVFVDNLIIITIINSELSVSAPLLVYDSRLESAIPTDMPSFDAFWSGYYRKQERQPSTHEATFPDLVRALVDRSDTATQCPCCVVSNSA